MIETDFIVSKTDTKGRITYANRVFVDFAQYKESELLGKQHNIIRHPDMPRAVFHYMWTQLKNGEEFFGYVKNMAKDGSYYWTFAHVTDSRDHSGELLGYHSVRRKPKKSSVNEFAALYKEMSAEEKRAGAKHAIPAGMKVLTEHINRSEKAYEHYILTC